MLSILVVDDHVLFRESLASHLRRCEGISEVREAGSEEEGLQAVAKARTDVAPLSVDLPGGRVFETARAMRRMHDEIGILFLGGKLCDADIEEALAIRSQGIILKRDSLACLRTAIQQAHRREAYYSESIRNRLEEVNGRLVLAQSCSPTIGGLTPRERQLLVHLGQGISLKQAAAVMNITYKTADNQKASLMRKLGIHDRVELARFAIQEGLVSLAPRPSEPISHAHTTRIG